MKGTITIKDGKIKSNLGNYIKTLKDGTYFYQVYKPKRTRSLEENSYYWGVIVSIISDYTGFETEEVHELNKLLFLSEKKRIVKDKRRKLTIIKGTSTLSVSEFEKFCEDIRKWSSITLGLHIPLPNEADVIL